VDGTRRGTVGVIGTQRMHYENTINAVGYVAQLFAQSVGGESADAAGQS
jgi:heat-inducible transcriptional repressor